MTDNDIIKGIKMCIGEKRYCRDCPYNGTDCEWELDALDLINRQKAEIVKYKENCSKCGEKTAKVIHNLQELLGKQKAEIKRLTTLAELGNMRANDYRAMRDKLKAANAEIERLKKALDVVDIMEEQHRYALNKAKAEAIKEVATRSVSALQPICCNIDQFHLMSETLYNLVKEMVGDVSLN